jgi:ATP-dependent Clp protease ATP-binding subunit ClpA
MSVQKRLEDAQNIAKKQNHTSIGSIHMLIATLQASESIIHILLDRINIDKEKLRALANEKLTTLMRAQEQTNTREIPFENEIIEALSEAEKYSRDM